LTFLLGDPNTLLIGGSANNTTGKLYAIQVMRDAGNHITGFTGTATVFAEAAFNDGGVTYGPGNVLFLARWPENELGQTKPGSTLTDKIIDLTPFDVAFSVAGLNFVPAGFPGAGQLKIVSWSGGEWYTVGLAPDATGTFDVTSVTFETQISGGPEGFIYVPPGSPQFSDFNSMLVSEFSAGEVSTYQLDENGDPIPATRKPFITGLSEAEGAVTDPLTGDFLFSTFSEHARVIVVQGFAPPPVVRQMQLAPLTATNIVGTNHTVIATVTDGGILVSGIAVTFEVFAGVNQGKGGTEITDALGLASFTYTGDGGVGSDEIRASVAGITTAETIVSNLVTKNWLTLLGDVNGNGSLDLDDARLILEVLVGLNPPQAIHFTTAGDVNADGSINNLDSIVLVALVAEEIPPLPDSTRITVVNNGNDTVTVAGAPGAVLPSSIVNVTVGDGTPLSVTASDNGSFRTPPVPATQGAKILIDNDGPARIAVTAGDTFAFILDASRLDDPTQRLP
jgi:hypothetical protein